MVLKLHVHVCPKLCKYSSVLTQQLQLVLTGMPNVTKFKVTLDYFHEGQFISHSYQPNLRPERPEANCVSNLCIYVACMG